VHATLLGKLNFRSFLNCHNLVQQLACLPASLLGCLRGASLNCQTATYFVAQKMLTAKRNRISQKQDSNFS
jgi:hypothetical protein